MKPTQTGFTELANNFLFAIAHLYPGPCMMAFPTGEMAKKHSKKKIAPSVAAMECLTGKIKEARSRDSGNTLLIKEFPGGSWTFTGSNSPAAARSDSIRYLILDDYDGFETNVGGEGDPGDLFRKRTDAFGARKKIYVNSTPTVKDFSPIEREYNESSMGRFFVPCPHCDEMQYLEFGGVEAEFGIKFSRDDVGEIIDVWYQCRHCKQRIDEHHKTKMMAGGKYIHKYPDRKKRGFKINSLYSPLGWLSWEQIAEEFLKAGKNAEKLQVWTNTRMAETWEAEGSQPDHSLLMGRREGYRFFQVPDLVRIITAGVDVQDDRLYIVVRGWGLSEESWLLWYGEMYGDPDRPEVWAQLDEVLNRPYRKIMSDEKLYIAAMAIDTGGHKTQSVYNYARLRHPRVMAIKGATSANRPIISRPKAQDVNYAGREIKGGVQLWSLGTDTAKATIYSRLKLTTDGPGCYHWPMEADEAYFMSLTAEKLVTKFTKGFPKQEWQKIRERNDALDCEVYAYGAALRSGVHFIEIQNNRPAQRPPEPQQEKSIGNRKNFNRPSWLDR